jgi:hypothetical protein
MGNDIAGFIDLNFFFQIHILSELTIQCVIGLGRYVRFF